MKRIGAFLHHVFVASDPRNRFCLWCGIAVAAEDGVRNHRGVYCTSAHLRDDSLQRSR